MCVDRDGIGVEVEQPAAAVDGRGQVAQIGECEPATDVVDARLELHDAVAVGEAERAPIGSRFRSVLLDARNRGGDEVCEHAFTVERLAQRQAEIDRSDRCLQGVAAATRTRTQLGRCRRVDLPHGRVELPHARESGRPRDRGEVEHCGLHEHPRGLGALRACERERAGADLGPQLALDLAHAVAQPGGEPGDAFPVDDAVRDGAHRPGHEIGARVPLG